MMIGIAIITARAITPAHKSPEFSSALVANASIPAMPITTMIPKATLKSGVLYPLPNAAAVSIS